ncbi:haloacid dehalogenase-like hydrolase [Streptomyces sp. XM4011]|uniref:HAD family hydrolase n=1 Tax=Streptomyces sp. XM4011 TaxID=2929780 RepID=UPI001FF8F3BF|nr:haloacid dehalogenase-like hydrolase [Streptomyces sp. XM4011]MCK1812775.1 haloacid dehalogenase-like hydrolase [Streptomyces sp. XM4011]
MTTLLVLWDIDHTLIAMRGIGGQLFGIAFEQTLGVPMKRQALIDGMTDQTIFAATAREHGITVATADFSRFAVALADAHVAHLPQIRERGHALPGAPSAVAAFAALGIRQSVATGNIAATARIKLAAFGLDNEMDWPAGAFGDDADNRPDLIRTARLRSGHQPTDIVVIGDTPADIHGARTNNIRAVGIASGKSTENELRAAGAGATLTDLTDTKRLLEAVGIRAKD